MDFDTAKTILERRSMKVGECWEWQGPLLGKGYGKVQWFFEDGDVAYTAHRASFRAFNGPIPRNASVFHTCTNRRCVNPAHLVVHDKES